VLTFFILKILGGHAKTSVTLLFLNIIKLNAADKFGRKYRANVEYFVMKCQAIIGMNYSDITI